MTHTLYFEDPRFYARAQICQDCLRVYSTERCDTDECELVNYGEEK